MTKPSRKNHFDTDIATTALSISSNIIKDDDHDDKNIETSTIISSCNPVVVTTTTATTAYYSNLVSRFDRWLTFYTNFVSKAGNQDKLLKLLQWSLYMASVSVLELNRKKSADRHNQNNNTVSPISSGLRKLYLEISMARYVIRLLGFPTALEAFRNNSWTIQPSNDDHAIKDTKLNYYYWIGKILAGSMVLYYPTEMLAYVHWMAPQVFPPSLSSPRTGNRWSYISCRFWVLYIIAELLQSIMQRNEISQKLLKEKMEWNHHNNDCRRTTGISIKSFDKIVVVSETSSHDDNSNGEVDSQKNQYDEQQHHDTIIASLTSSYQSNQLQIYRNLLFLLPCINWSLPNWDVQPWLTEKTVNTLMWLESIVCIHQAILNQK